MLFITSLITTTIVWRFLELVIALLHHEHNCPICGNGTENLSSDRQGSFLQGRYTPGWVENFKVLAFFRQSIQN